MYSPKINDEYIPLLYRLAKSRDIRMTHLVNEIISEALEEVNLKTNERREKGNVCPSQLERHEL